MSKWTSLCEILKTANEAKALAEQALSSGGTGIVVDGKPTEGSKNAVSSGGVYDAIDSLAIKGNKSGSAVACDVSPIEHTLKVKARRKNILSPNYYHATGRETNGITFTVDGNGLITANGEATSSAMFIMKYATNPVALEIGKAYVLSGVPQGASVSTYYMTLSADDNSAFITDLGSGKAFTATRSSYTLIIYIEKGTKAENLIFKPQIEEGAIVTAFAPFIADITTASVIVNGSQTYPINADGTVEGVKSLYPTTTLIADTEGIVLDVEYNRDINSAFAELQGIVNTLVGG